MANPPRFWAWFIGTYAAAFTVVDVACAIGPANGDTACECLAARLDTPTKRVGFAVGVQVAGLVFTRHILKDRTRPT